MIHICIIVEKKGGGMEHMMIKKGFTDQKSICAILLLGIFTFLFLGAEYQYVNMIGHTSGEEKTVLVQDYALGVSAVGFLFYPLFQRFFNQRIQTAGLFILALAVSVCNFLVQQQVSYWVILLSGMALFLFLGLLGGASHHLFFKLTKDHACLARMVGISYGFGILLQFLNNNLVNREAVEAVILSLTAFALLFILLKAESLCRPETVAVVEPSSPANEGDEKEIRKKEAAGALLALLVILMACIFSTLDNAVTMHHVAGMDIGQWPRLLLAVSGLAAGFLFDIKNRKYMIMMMYCVMLLSVICVVVLKLGGPVLAGLIVFYLSAGFFVVFFTTCFLDFASHMPTPALWAGMGRAMNNVSAFLFCNLSVALLVSDSSGMAAVILTQVLFVAVSIVIYLYTAWMSAPSDDSDDTPAEMDSEEAFHVLTELLGLTPKETVVFDKLVNSEENIQEIADGLYLSRRTCQRHIASIYEKAGVKSRMGLYQLYIKKQRRL